MQLIPAKCPDCGADIKIPEGSTSLVCDYCGGNILVTDVLGATSVMQNCMMLAYSAMDSGNYRDAYDHFNRAIEIDLKNPNAWFGKAICIGMTGKISENMFGQMIDLFENSFQKTSADKQLNLKKNAAAEIVKVMKHSQKHIQLAGVLLTLSNDAELSAEITKLRETVINTVKVALEYDPKNKDAALLLDNMTSGKFFESEETQKEKEKLPDWRPLNPEIKTAPLVITNQETSTQASQQTSKKGGCSMVLIILLMTILSTGLLLRFLYN